MLSFSFSEFKTPLRLVSHLPLGLYLDYREEVHILHVCIIMVFVMYAAESVFMFLMAKIAKCFDRTEEEININQTYFDNNPYPYVLIQLPMFNEEHYCTRVIENCCAMEYPTDRMLIQVCDDSTDMTIVSRIEAFCQLKQKEGFRCELFRRTERKGFKAGAMKCGLDDLANRGLVFKYCAIFDADFEPCNNFLVDTLPFLEKDDNLAFVQTAWSFKEVKSHLQWFQFVSLSYHFHFEQYMRGFFGFFFGFNGTGGVWRIEAIDKSGGWQDDTTVEDMDLSLRVYLEGWHFKYIDSIECINEIPASHVAYRTQQWRWLSGPMQVLRKTFKDTFRSSPTRKNAYLPFWKRLTIVYFWVKYFLGAMMIIAGLIYPIIHLSIGGHIITTMAMMLSLAISTPITRWTPLYTLFSCMTANLKLIAMLGGLLNLESTKTWVVTKKGENANDLVGGQAFRIERDTAIYFLGISGWIYFTSNQIEVFMSCLVLASFFLFAARGELPSEIESNGVGVMLQTVKNAAVKQDISFEKAFSPKGKRKAEVV